jgi:hypothetical protein
LDPPQFIARKGVNAFFKEIDADMGIRSDLTRQYNLVIASAKAIMGGLWVGGHVVLTDRDITFEPTALNRALHQGDIDQTPPLEGLDDVQVKWALVTSIIEMMAGKALFRIRCWGAKNFAEVIRQQVTARKSHQISAGS